MADLGVLEVHQGESDKAAVLDDLAPSNAAAEVKRVAHWVGRRGGGAGAVREAVEAILQARQAWPPA